jgi:hypothetical protein
MKKFLTLVVLMLLLATSAMAYDYSDAVDSNSDSVGIAPTPAYEDELIQCVTDLSTSATLIYEWEKNGVTQTYTDNEIDASLLNAEDEWTCNMAYVTEFNGTYIEVPIGSETVEIQEVEDTNPDTTTYAPRATDIHFTVTEGDLIDLDVIYFDNFSDYSTMDLRTSLFSSETVYIFDADSTEDELSYYFAFSELDMLSGTWQTEIGDAGDHTSTFYVWDEEGNYNSATIEFTVLADVNEAPVIDPINDIYVYEGETASATATATDPDGDVVGFRWDSMDLDLSSDSDITVINDNFEWITEIGDSTDSPYNVMVTAYDPEGLSDNTSFNIYVLEVEEIETQAPLVADIFLTVTEGDLVDIDVEYYSAWEYVDFFFASVSALLSETSTVPVFDWDSSESDLTWEFSTPLDASSGEWQTIAGNEGIHYSTITVTDETGNSTIATIEITVEAVGDDNTCPVVTANDVTVYEGETAIADYTFYDADADITITSFTGVMWDHGEWETQIGDSIGSPYEVTVYVNDGQCIGEDTFMVYVLEAGDENTCPIGTVNNPTVEEGETASVVVSASDADGDSLTYTFTSTDLDLTASDVTYDTTSGTLDWVTEVSDEGTYEVFITVSDGETACDVELISTIIVSAASDENTCPVVTANDVTVYEGETAIADYTFYDADADITITSFSGVMWDHGEWETQIGDSVGSPYEVTVSVNDGQCIGEDTFMVYVLEVEDENTCPLASVFDVDVYEGAEVIVEVAAIDVDGDTLTYSWSSSDLDLTDADVSIADNIMTWSTVSGDEGVYYVDIIVSDGDCEVTVTSEITIRALANNCPIATVNNPSVEEGETASIIVNATDSDGDSLTYTFTSTDLDLTASDVTYDTTLGTLDWVTEISDEGSYEVYITVSDGEIACDVELISTIIVSAVSDENTCPTGTVNDPTVEEGETASVVVIATDADGDSLTYSFASADLDLTASDVTYDTTLGTLDWVTEVSDEGTYEVTITVSDSETDCDLELVSTITVEAASTTGENTCPVVTANDITVTAGDLAIADYTFSDADGDITIISFSGVMWDHGEWQTSVGDEGTYEITVSINDGQCISEDTFTVTVEAAAEPTENTCPVVTANDITVTAGDLAIADYTASDADGDSLTVSFSDLFDSNGEWQTSESDEGTYEVTISVDDGECVSEATFTVTVEAASEEPTENTCPLVTANDITVTAGDLAIADYTASDADGDSLTITFSDLFDSNGEWQTSEGDEGTYIITLSVDDGECTSRVTFTVIVEAASEEPTENTCPVLTTYDITIEYDCVVDEDGLTTCTDADENYYSFDADGNYTGFGVSITFEERPTIYEVTDADGDELSVSIEATGDWLQDYIDSGYNHSIIDAYGGVFDYIVYATDGECEVSSAFTMTIVENFADDGDDTDENGSEGSEGSNYEGSKLEIENILVLNASDLYSAYDVSGLTLELTGSFEVEDNYLHSTSDDDEIKVLVNLFNKNSFDAEGIQVTFVLEGEEIYKASFSDIDRNNEATMIYTIPIPEDLDTGRYGLLVIVENEDMYSQEVFNLSITSLGDSIEYETETTVIETNSFWEDLVDFLGNLF